MACDGFILRHLLYKVSVYMTSSDKTAYDFTATDIDGRPRSLSEFAGQALLIVNVASKCGFTPQYTGLEALWRKRRGEGFAVLGFPCDQFGHQEPGDEAEIKQFCSLNYDVTFPLFAKIEVNGAGTHPLYLWLKGEKAGVFGTEAIKWNFTSSSSIAAGKSSSASRPRIRRRRSTRPSAKCSLHRRARSQLRPAALRRGVDLRATLAACVLAAALGRLRSFG